MKIIKIGLLVFMGLFLCLANLQADIFGPIDNLQDLLDVSISSPADNEVLTYNSTTSKWGNEAAGVSFAPIGATYLTSTANTSLTNEIDLGSLATGLLKGTVAGGISTISAITDNSTNWNLGLLSTGATTGATSQAQTFTNGIIMGDASSIGLGAGKGLIQFDDETTDFISFSNANVGIGTTSPGTLLTLSGATTPFASVNFTTDTSYGGFKFTQSGNAIGYFLSIGSNYADATRRNYMDFQNWKAGGGLGFWTSAVDSTPLQRMLINTDGNIFINTTDTDGTPTIGKLTVKGSTNDGTTNIFVGRDSDEANVAWIDTNGDLHLLGDIYVADQVTVTLGIVQIGEAGTSGVLKIYSEQGVTDYIASLYANTAMTSAASFYLPADEPAAESFLKMGTDGIMDYDTATYQAADADLTTYASITPTANAQTLLGETFAQMQGSLSIDDLITLSGVAEGSVNLATFTGTTIADNVTIKAALQALETSVETKQATVTEGSLADSVILSADIKNGEIVSADLSGTAGITLAQTAMTAGRSLTISTNDVAADAELYTDTKCLYFENPVATDDFKSIWLTKQAATLTSIWAESDQTVTFMLQVDDGSAADVDSVDLAPAAGVAEDTALDGDATMAAGDRLDLAVTSVANTPTWCSICFTFAYDD